MSWPRISAAVVAAVSALALVPAPAPADTITVNLPCVDVVIIQINCTPAPTVTPNPPGTPKGCKDSALEPDNHNLQRIRAATLCLLNKERTSRHLAKLHSNATLRNAARTYSRRLVVQKFFDHTSPNGTTMLDRIRRTSYLKVQPEAWWVGENLAWGSSGNDTPAKIVDAWMHSAGHRKNILNSHYRDIGLGTTLGTPRSAPGSTYVTDFGRRIR